MINRKRPPYRDWAEKEAFGQEENGGGGKKGRIIVLLLIVLLAGGGWFYFFGRDRDNEEQVAEAEPEPVPVTAGRPLRRAIYDRNLEELAVSFRVSSVYVKPLEFDNIEITVAALARVLDLDEKKLLDELKTQRGFKWLVKNISPAKAKEVEELHLQGVYFYGQEQRYYPERDSMAHIIGVVKDSHGLSGIEYRYDDELEADRQGGDEGGAARDLVLTLDRRMHSLLAGRMHSLLAEVRGTLGQTALSALVMDKASGEILAYVQLPSLQGDGLKDSGGDQLENRLLSEPVDPGALALLFKVAKSFDQKPDPLAPLEEEVEEIKVIAPRQMKIVKRVKRSAKWARLPDGTFVTTWLAESLDELEQASADEKDQPFLDLERDLPIRGLGELAEIPAIHGIDLPGRLGAQGTGIHLLEGFATLVNGGQRLTPHFLKALVTEKREVLPQVWPVKDSGFLTAEASAAFVDFLGQGVPDDDRALITEILKPREGEVPLSVLRLYEDGRGDGRDTAEKRTGESEAATATEEEDLPPVVDDVKGLVLAATPRQEPELVMILTLDGGRIDISRVSPLKQAVAAFLKEAMPLARRKSAAERAKKVDIPRREELYQDWLAKQDVMPGRFDGAETVIRDEMVDVRGMSLRKALQTVQHYGVKVMIEGSGVVRKQFPPPGGKVAGATIILKAEVAGADTTK